MRIYRTITLLSQFNDFCVSKIYMKSVPRDNVFGSSILRFSMFSFSAAESSKFISFNLDLYNSLFYLKIESNLKVSRERTLDWSYF